MGPGSQLTTQSHMPEDFSDLRTISDELQSSLPGELVEIENGRLRIEAVIARLDMGDVLRHLCISALTPGQKNIVRYELDTLPSGALASNLAALVSRAKDRNVPAENVLKSIQECLQHGGPFRFKKIEPEKNPFVMPSMERSIPDFERFARDPLVMDTAFSVQRDLPEARINAVATLFPENRYTLIEAHTFPKREGPIPPVCTFKVRCPASFWEKPRTTEEVVAALHSATWEAMDAIISDGAERARRKIVDPELDERLIQGVVNPTTCDTLHTLPSGARVLLEEGDRVVCVRIESSDEEPSTASFWRIFAQENLLLANDPKLITTRSAVESLVEGDIHQRLKAIQALDRLERAYPEQIPPETLTVNPFQTVPLEDIVGFQTAQMLSRLHRTKKDVLRPVSEMLVLDLLDGIHSIQLSPKDPGHSGREPQDPKYLFLGFRTDGALKVTIMSPLQNYLETLVPVTYFNDQRTREDVVERLATLFDNHTTDAFNELRREIESLSLKSKGESCNSMKLRPAVLRFPSVENEALENALDMAADIALIYEADLKASINDVQVIFDAHRRCELVVTGKYATPQVRMHLHTSEQGVHAIDLYVTEQNQKRRHHFTLGSPLELPDGREVLTTMFKLLHAPLGSEAPLHPGVVPRLTSTQLFKYLKDVEGRFAEF